MLLSRDPLSMRCYLVAQTLRSQHREGSLCWTLLSDQENGSWLKALQPRELSSPGMLRVSSQASFGDLQPLIYHFSRKEEQQTKMACTALTGHEREL